MPYLIVLSHYIFLIKTPEKLRTLIFRKVEISTQWFDCCCALFASTVATNRPLCCLSWNYYYYYSDHRRTATGWLRCKGRASTVSRSLHCASPNPSNRSSNSSRRMQPRRLVLAVRTPYKITPALAGPLTIRQARSVRSVPGTCWTAKIRNPKSRMLLELLELDRLSWVQPWCQSPSCPSTNSTAAKFSLAGGQLL